MNIEEIVTKAIPQETCPIKNANAMHRREELKKRVNKYVQDQLSKQFNARDMSEPFKPDLEYKEK